MQLIIQVLFTFLKFLPDKKVNFGKSVIAALTLNATKFANLPFTVVVLQALNDALANAQLNVLSGSRASKAALKTAIKAWNNGFKLTGKYVNLIANGDANIILAGGYEHTKPESTPHFLPTIMQQLTLLSSMVKGFFKATVKTDTNVDMYVFVAAPETVVLTQTDDTLIITVGTISTYVKINSTHSVNFNNLSNVKYNVSSFGVNSIGNGPIGPSTDITPR